MTDPFDSPIGRKILDKISDPLASFVFPTQRSADSWAYSLVRWKKTKAVETDRFIGADRYLGVVTAGTRPQDREEASSVSRLFWALGIIAEQREKPFLKELLPAEFEAPLSRAGFLARIAPRLHLIRDATLAGDIEFGPDYSALCRRYDEFLVTNGLFESAMLGTIATDNTHYIFIEPRFSGISPSTMHEENPYASAVPVLHKFRHFREESDWVFRSIRSLIDMGYRPLDIAVSVPNLSGDMKAHLLRAAREFKVPVAFFGGEPLSSSPFGKLLFSLSRAMEEGFSARTLRKMAERGSPGFRDRRSLNRLVAIASRWNIPEMSEDRRRMSALWARTFAECRINDSGALTLYRNLVRLTSAIRGSKDFKTLEKALFDLRTSLLDESSLDSHAQATLQRIFDGLEKLKTVHEKLRTPSLPARPFAVLLLELERTHYSPVVRTDSVSIQSYALGVLLAAKKHFILDASQDSTGTAAAHFNSLPEAQATRAETEAKLGDLVLESFGPGAVFCHADESLSGFTVPHPFFTLRGSELVTIAETPNNEAVASAIPRLKASRSPSEAIAGALKSISGAWKGDSIRFSPSKLRAFVLCPLKWLLSSVEGIDFQPADAAILAEGSLMHAMIRGLLEEIKGVDGKVKPERRDEYLSKFDRIFADCIDVILRQSGVALQPGLEATRARLRNRLSLLLEFEIGLESEGWEIGSFEVPLSQELGDKGIVLEGRADRVLERDTGSDVAVIDYKRKSIPAKKDLGLREDGSLREFQVASYAEMLGSAGKTPALGLYWSIENCKSAVAFGSGGTRATWAEFEPERRELRGMIERAAGKIRSGEYLRATPSPEACDGCAFRSVCRAYFSSESL
jgi:hypothetical protein